VAGSWGEELIRWLEPSQIDVSVKHVAGLGTVSRREPSLFALNRQVVFNDTLWLVSIFISPADDSASANRMEVAGGAHTFRIAVAPGQRKETQDRCMAPGAPTAHEVRIMAA
jgi:hypothetical protein